MKPLLILKKKSKRNKVKRTRAKTEKKELEPQERRLQIAQDQQNQLLTNLMAQNNQFLAVISNITGKKIDFRERNFACVFDILLTLSSSCIFSFFHNSEQSLKVVPYKQGKSLENTSEGFPVGYTLLNENKIAGTDPSTLCRTDPSTFLKVSRHSVIPSSLLKVTVKTNATPCFFPTQFTKIQKDPFKFSNKSFVENHLVYNQTKSFASL